MQTIAPIKDEDALDALGHGDPEPSGGDGSIVVDAEAHLHVRLGMMSRRSVRGIWLAFKVWTTSART